MATKRRISVNKINLLLDTGIGITFIVEEQIHRTGIHTHELLGVAFGAALLVHLALHWRWVVSITRNFFHNFSHQSRLHYILNVTIFVDMLLATISGILISHTLTIPIPRIFQNFVVWGRVHFVTSELGIILIGLHVIIHWKWILVTVRRYLFPWLKIKMPARLSTIINHVQAKQP